MVTMTALNESARKGAQELVCDGFDDAPYTGSQLLANARVALVSSAGLMQRGELNVKGGTGDYRVIDNSTDDGDVFINHVSVNFDRTGYSRDINVVLPRDRLRELVDEGTIAGMSDAHYSFMGATEPEHMEAHAIRLAGELKSQGINTVCLLPV